MPIAPSGHPLGKKTLLPTHCPQTPTREYSLIYRTRTL